MKIFNNKIEKAMQVYRKQEFKKEVKGTSKLEKKDELQISNEAKEFQVAMAALKNVPDIRQDKVDEIKRQIQTGTYQVDSGKIVEKMFENISIKKKI